jgi:hypothetical protein
MKKLEDFTPVSFKLKTGETGIGYFRTSQPCGCYVDGIIKTPHNTFPGVIVISHNNEIMEDEIYVIKKLD